MNVTQEDLELMLGRINGVHAGLLNIARCLPAPLAQVCANEVRTSAERVHADALASPLPDNTLNEMERVVLQLAQVLEAAAKDRTHGR